MKPTKIFTALVFISIFFGISSLFAGCNMVGGRDGDGNVLKETRTIGSFSAIEVSGAFDIILKQGATEEVTIEADQNILPLVRTEVVGHTLKIDTRKPIHHVTVLRAYITVKSLDNIDASGAVDIETDGRITVPSLTIDASGSSDSKLDLDVKELKLDCSGASKIKFSGIAGDVRMDLSGATDIYAFDMVTESINIQISGAGNAQINVTKSLRAEISGAGNVKYKGSPEVIDQSVSGAGTIKKVQ